MLKDFASSIVRTLREHDHTAYLVGGCVRDLLLGLEPADYDVATDATPQEVIRIFPETYAVGVQFGVVLVPLVELADQVHTVSATSREPSFARQDSREPALSLSKGRLSPHEPDPLKPPTARREDVASYVSTKKAGVVEVATFRSDIGYSDGRHPDEVRFTQDPREDVARRDFTINGLLLDPLTEEVLDFVGGRNDLQRKIIRAIGDPERRFAEDKLRMLRAVRFAARFGYSIEPDTWAAIQKLAPEIDIVSRERVRDELTRMLTEGHARDAFLLLDASGLLRAILPEISAMKGVEQPPQFHPEGDVFVHTLLALENLPHRCPPALAWGTLLHDVGKPATFRVAPDRIRFDGHVDVGVKMAEAICSRLRFSGDDTEQVLALVDNHMRFGQVMHMSQSTLKKFLRMPHFEQHLALHRADCMASHGNLASYEFVQAKLAEIPPEKMRPPRLVSGDDLMAAGYLPGPVFRKILDAVENAQLEGNLSSPQAAMEFVRREFPL